jgi:hypothetical protein
VKGKRRPTGRQELALAEARQLHDSRKAAG